MTLRQQDWVERRYAVNPYNMKAQRIHISQVFTLRTCLSQGSRVKQKPASQTSRPNAEFFFKSTTNKATLKVCFFEQSFILMGHNVSLNLRHEIHCYHHNNKQ
jgi:hypothetical protein